MITSPSVVARRFDFVREVGGANRGAWVQMFQRFTGNPPGDAWCASFVSFVLDVAYLGKSPLTKTASCHLMLAHALTMEWITHTPQVDDLFFYLTDDGVAHHVGVVSGVAPLIGIAGNTSADGQSVNGVGVFEHAIKASTFVRLPK